MIKGIHEEDNTTQKQKRMSYDPFKVPINTHKRRYYIEKETNCLWNKPKTREGGSSFGTITTEALCTTKMTLLDTTK